MLRASLFLLPGNVLALSFLREHIIETLRCLSSNPHWIVFLGSMLPVVEGRYGVIFGRLQGLSLLEAVALACLGNTLVVWPIYWVTTRLLRAGTERGPFKLVLSHAVKVAKKQERRIVRYGPAALVAFAAVPLPGFGVWTGAMAAAALRLPWRMSFFSVALGGILSVVIVALTAQGLGKLAP